MALSTNEAKPSGPLVRGLSVQTGNKHFREQELRTTTIDLPNLLPSVEVDTLGQ